MDYIYRDRKEVPRLRVKASLRVVLYRDVEGAGKCWEIDNHSEELARSLDCNREPGWRLRIGITNPGRRNAVLREWRWYSRKTREWASYSIDASHSTYALKEGEQIWRGMGFDSGAKSDRLLDFLAEHLGSIAIVDTADRIWKVRSRQIREIRSQATILRENVRQFRSAEHSYLEQGGPLWDLRFPPR